MFVDIVVVNWNAGELLSNCVHSILQYPNTEFLRKIIIVDNSSSDDSIASLPQNKSVKIIFNPVNQGFARACNQGFREADANYVLLLNPDTILNHDTLALCYDFMTASPAIDVMGSALTDESGRVLPSCSRFPTAAKIFNDATGISKILPGLFKPATLMTDWDHGQSRQVDQVMGAFMFMQRSVFSRVGYFDERFFVYFEELDFSKRLKESGGVSFYNKEIKVVHKGGGTTHAVKSFRLFLFLKSRTQYAQKYFGPLGRTTVFFSTWFIEPLMRILQQLLSGRLREAGNVINAYLLLGSYWNRPYLPGPEEGAV